MMTTRTVCNAIFLFLTISIATPDQGEPFPLPDLEPITSSNIDEVEQLAILPVDSLSSARRGIAFSPNDELLAVRDEDNCGAIQVWNVTTGQSSVFRGQPYAWGMLRFSPNGTILLCTGSDDEEGIDRIQLWDVQSNRLLNVLDGSDYVESGPRFSPDGTILAVGYRGGVVILWDTATGKRIALIDMKPDPVEISSPPVNSVVDLEFSPDGTLLAIGSIDRNELRSVETAGRLVSLLSFFTTTDVAFSPDGTLLVCGSAGLIDWWAIDASENEATAQLLRKTEYPGHGAVFSPDGTMLATVGGNMDNVARLWDVATGELLTELEGITDDVWNVAFSPDASLVIAQNIIWDAASGEQLLMFEDTVMLSPGGRLLALVDDGQLEIWGVPSHR